MTNTDTILVRVQGPDHPGVLAGLLGIIAQSGAEIQDVEQVVIRNRLTLGIVTAVPTGRDLVKELRRVGITEFTISSSWGDLVSRLAVWQAEGARICGVTTVLYEGSGIEPTEEKHAALLMKL